MRLRNEDMSGWVVVHPEEKLERYAYSLCAARGDSIKDFLEDRQTPKATESHKWSWYKRRGYRCVKVTWTMDSGWSWRV